MTPGVVVGVAVAVWVGWGSPVAGKDDVCSAGPAAWVVKQPASVNRSNSTAMGQRARRKRRYSHDCVLLLCDSICPSLPGTDAVLSMPHSITAEVWRQ